MRYTLVAAAMFLAVLSGGILLFGAVVLQGPERATYVLNVPHLTRGMTPEREKAIRCRCRQYFLTRKIPDRAVRIQEAAALLDPSEGLLS